MAYRIASIVFIVTVLCLPSTGALAQGANALPGEYLHAKAMDYYERGNHYVAYKTFLKSARWADKLSQFNLGVMHFKGQGMEADKARAWAWFKLSAERGYPKMTRMVEHVEKELGDAQLERGRRILEDELKPEYGDAVAVPKATRRMEKERENITGSRTGFVGNLDVLLPDGTTMDGQSFYKEGNWDYQLYIQREKRIFDALDRGNVTLGEFDIVEDEEGGNGEGNGGNGDSDR